jgi:hypothetical protein
LGIRKTGIVDGVFHAPTEAALKMSRPNPCQMSTHHSLSFHSSSRSTPESQRLSKKPIIQTDSYENYHQTTGIPQAARDY